MDPESTTSGPTSEESALLADLRTALPPIGKGVKELVEILREVDETRGPTAPVTRSEHESVAADGKWTAVAAQGSERVFEPWETRSLDRLLLKFDFGDVDEFLAGKVEGL